MTVNIDSGIFTCPQRWLTEDINIAVMGVGATGSAVATMLYKLNHIRREMTDNQFGINVTFFDPKAVTQTGYNRTGFLRSEIGQNKALCMANKLNNAYGKIFAYGAPTAFSLSALRNPRQLDVLITATDSASSRNQIAKQSKRLDHGCLWLDIGVGDTQGNVVLGELGKGKSRLPTVSDLFPSMQAEVQDKAQNRASCDVLDAITRQAFGVNETGAAFGIGLLSRLMLFGSINTQGCIYDVAQCRSTPININRMAWKSFGYLYRKPAKAKATV
jgi:PRTRC genetic system ThiF family protein